MNRLLVRFTLSLFGAVALSFLLVSLIIKHSIESQRDEVMPPIVQTLERVTLRRIEGVPPEQLGAVLDEVTRDLGVQMALVEVQEAPPDAREALERGEHTWAFHHRGAEVFIPLDHGQAVRAGPLFDPPDPSQDIGLILATIALVVVAFGLALSTPMVRRLRALEAAAVRISEGDLSARTEPGRARDAIASLAHRFNLMADRVQTLIDGHEQLVRAVAHEIRTPLARVRFGLEMMELAEDPAQRARREADVVADLDELEQLVDELLFFSRYGVGARQLNPGRIPVRAALERLVKRAVVQGSTVEVGVDCADEVHLVADPRSFNRAMRNLILNGIRYASTRVDVHVTEEEDEVVIEVSDDGPGVPEADRERIFEPFARVDDSRNRDTGGVGLGLAIVRWILEGHGGTVDLEPASGGGARFVTRWPRDGPRD